MRTLFRHPARLMAALAMLLVQAVAHGADYGPARIDHYDGATGLYFRSLTEQRVPTGLVTSYTPTTVVTNLNIYDPATDSSVRYFETPPAGTISDILFETGKTGDQLDVISLGGGWRFKHNVGLPEDRTPRDKLLVGVHDDAAATTTLYVSDKHGKDRQILVVVPDSADWHIDAANGKLRVVHATKDNLTIESFDW
jgi:hypothetical protein